MQSAVLARSDARVPLDPGRVRDIVLLRVAAAVRGLARAEMANDLSGLVSHRLSPAQWRTELDAASAALVSGGFVGERGTRLEATEAGVARAIAFLGLKGGLPRIWGELRDVRLVARALGLHREPASRLKALATADGLRMAVVQSAFGLGIKGIPTASRLRAALATVALERAFGNQITAGLGGKAGFSATAGRVLAGQLAQRPRDFGTDTRLIAALAAEHLGVARSDLASLRLGVLRRFLEARGPEDSSVPASTRTREPKPAGLVAAPVQAAGMPGGKPDAAGFVREVRRLAVGQAQGWSGNRRAFISHVWRQVREQRPEWGVSEIEFKCMLAEAHRAGHVSLAHADLKDSKNIKDLQESAVVFKNAVFHYIQVDA